MQHDFMSAKSKKEHLKYENINKIINILKT